MDQVKKLLVVLLIIGIYLHFSYAYFYNFLGQKHLVAPVHKTQIMFTHNSSDRTINYVSLGDSLTAGVGVSSYTDAFPYMLAQKLSGKYSVLLSNFSQAGATSDKVLTSQVPQALTAKPDIVTLLVGVNDIHNLVSLKQFDSNLMAIIRALKNTPAKIYLFSLPYLGSDKIVYFPYNLILDFRTRQFNSVIERIANYYQVRYIDLYHLSKGANFYSADGFHPKAEGYKEWLEATHVN